MRKWIFVIVFIRVVVGWNNLRLVKHFFNFTKTGAIGSNSLKILYRFNDLNKIFKNLPKKLKVLEFGQGSSTFFFVGSKKVEKLTSLEEDPKYILELKNEKLFSVVSPVRILHFQNYAGTAYTKSPKYIEEANLIYVDGPVSKVDSMGFPMPNLDLIDHSLLQGKVIVVDGRVSTCVLLLKLLKNTHDFFPSKAFMAGYRNYLGQSETSKLTNFETHSLNEFQFAHILIRTSLFVPRTI